MSGQNLRYVHALSTIPALGIAPHAALAPVLNEQEKTN
jgi:hypothetical protein